MNLRSIVLAVIVVTAAVVVTCTIWYTRSEPPSATPTPTASATGTPAAASATPAVTPTLPTLTGAPIPEIVRQVIQGVIGRDAASLTALADYQQVGCTTAQGVGGPPKCKPGDPQGTVYRMFPTGSCEGEWSADARTVFATIVTSAGPLYAAATLMPKQPNPEPYWPQGDAVVIFGGQGANAPGAYFILSSNRIVRAHRICGAGGGGEEALLQPLGANAYLIPPPTPTR